MPDFVLIPGAWMGAGAWEPVTDGLRKLGHRVYPLTLWLADRLVGHPGRTVSEPAVLSRPLKERRGTCVSCAFETPDDLSVLRGEPGWSFLELDSGHWPMVSVPEELVELLVEVAERG